MKLKTLKDMKSPIAEIPPYKKENMCSRIELRQEAIKWVKAIKNSINMNKELEDIQRGRAEGRIDFAKEFFNITEEELK